MKIVIHKIPPSNNKYMGNSHNFNIYREEKVFFQWLIKAAIRERPKKPLKKAIVHIQYYFPDRRRRDPDNYSGKMLLDPLVREGILQDDSFNNIELRLSAEVDTQDPRTEITVTEI